MLNNLETSEFLSTFRALLKLARSNESLLFETMTFLAALSSDSMFSKMMMVNDM